MQPMTWRSISARPLATAATEADDTARRLVRMASAQEKEAAAAAAVAEKAAEAAKKQMEKDVFVRLTPPKKEGAGQGLTLVHVSAQPEPFLPLTD